MSLRGKAGEHCLTCGNGNVFTSCAGCGILLCQECSNFELLGSGCGTVWPVWYCGRCVSDALINPNAAFKGEEH